MRKVVTDGLYWNCYLWKNCKVTRQIYFNDNASRRKTMKVYNMGPDLEYKPKVKWCHMSPPNCSVVEKITIKSIPLIKAVVKLCSLILVFSPTCNLLGCYS